MLVVTLTCVLMIQSNYLASGADTYLWSPSIFLSADNISNPWATPTPLKQPIY